MTELLESMRALEADHSPAGYPPVKMAEVSALCDLIENAHKALALQQASYEREIALDVADMRNRCAELVRHAYIRHGLCCADGKRIAELIEGLE
jgi:hypothetical protein